MSATSQSVCVVAVADMDEGHVGDTSAKDENGGGENGRGGEIPKEACGGERKRSGAERRSAGRRRSRERSREPAARGSPKRYVFHRQRRGARAEERENHTRTLLLELGR